jgi:protein-disulfide isomerase
MKPIPSRRAIGLVLLLCIFAAAPLLAEDPSTPAATVDGETIALEEVEAPIGARVGLLREQIYQLQRQRLDALIAERLIAKEAARRGMSAGELVAAEVISKVPPVSDDEVDVFYRTHKDRLPKDEPKLRERIRAHLENQKLVAQRSLFINRLRAKADINVLLKAPPIYRAKLNIEGAPVRGAADAPVTIVKFEDFQCSFCKEEQQIFTQLLARYQGRLRIVHKDFPIDELHPQARQEHLAARCAGEQGKFWPYHDALYANAPHGSPADLRNYAVTVGLDRAVFESCLTSAKYAAAVQKDLDEGKQAGVTGTPAFFVNGRFLPGAQPLERFVQLIDEELGLRP